MIPLEVLFLDNHLLAANKPPGLLTQPSGREEENLESFSKTWLKEKYKKAGNVFLEAVHRIDRPVGGIVLFSRTSKSLSRLQESVRKRDVRKIYYALVEGEFLEERGVLEDYLVHDRFCSRVALKRERRAKLSRLQYRTLGRRQGKTLLEISLDTGRYHQIRIQFSRRGYPILGDAKYGAKGSWNFPGIALHHQRMEIPHPISKEIQRIESFPSWIGDWP